MIKIKIVSYDKKFIGQSQYIVHTIVEDEEWDMHCETRITYVQFQSFHQAVSACNTNLLVKPQVQDTYFSKDAKQQYLFFGQRI